MAARTAHEHIPPSKRKLAEGGGVLLMGLPRSGTYSVAHALRILGHEHVFHNLDVPLRANDVWNNWFRAMWACKPYLRNQMGLPYFAKKDPPPSHFSAEDWDHLVGRDYQAIGDMTVYFVTELLETYPDAQVILWQRDFDSWYQSYENGVIQEFVPVSPFSQFVRKYISPHSQVYWHMTVWYGIAGWLQAKDLDHMRLNARDRYREHFETVRKMVRPGKLLEYRLGDGWEPLCEFLNCPVPDEAFPHLNEAIVLKGLGKKMNAEVLYLALWNLVRQPLLLGVLAFGLALGCRYMVDGAALFSFVSRFMERVGLATFTPANDTCLPSH